MLKITFSNRFESLLDSLLDAIAEPSESPFSSDQIIIPSTAIRRRLELAAADRFGICANVQFSFLAQWLWRQIAQVVPVGEVSPFTPPVLSWRVFEILGDSAFAAEHPPLASYLRSADALMRYDLALRTATLFDQYITYRPDWLAVWSDGRMVALPETDGPRLQNEHWQAALWRLSFPKIRGS